MGLGQIRWSRARTPSWGFCFPSKAGRGTGLFLQKVRSAPSKSSPGFVPPCSHLVSGSEKSWPVGIKQRNAWTRLTEHKSRDRRRPRLPLLLFENRAQVGRNQALGLLGRGAQECRVPGINHGNPPAKKDNILCQVRLLRGASDPACTSPVHTTPKVVQTPVPGPEGRARLSPASRRSSEQAGP